MGRAVCRRCEQTLAHCRCDGAQSGKASEQRSLLQMRGPGSTERQLLSVSRVASGCPGLPLSAEVDPGSTVRRRASPESANSEAQPIAPPPLAARCAVSGRRFAFSARPKRGDRGWGHRWCAPCKRSRRIGALVCEACSQSMTD
eukprot:11564778-Alexandrium_andersonii.AAC.1